MSTMPTALFGLGQIVRHREAAFRGVVVDVDPVFLGGGVETGQVPRDQPFYRILAVGEDGGFLAYAAQDTLEHDPDTGSLSPMDQRNLFTVDAQGRYAPKSHAIH